MKFYKQNKEHCRTLPKMAMNLLQSLPISKHNKEFCRTLPEMTMNLLQSLPISEHNKEHCRTLPEIAMNLLQSLPIFFFLFSCNKPSLKPNTYSLIAINVEEDVSIWHLTKLTHFRSLAHNKHPDQRHCYTQAQSIINIKQDHS